MRGGRILIALQFAICVIAVAGLLCAVALFCVGKVLAFPGNLVCRCARWFGIRFDDDLTEAYRWLEGRR
jgi:hypothetical protein